MNSRKNSAAAWLRKWVGPETLLKIYCRQHQTFCKPGDKTVGAWVTEEMAPEGMKISGDTIANYRSYLSTELEDRQFVHHKKDGSSKKEADPPENDTAMNIPNDLFGTYVPNDLLKKISEQLERI
ncbi:unnamed protein product, partial [marine sediment metagenome]